MQYIPCNSALLAKETLFLTQKGTFLAKYPQKNIFLPDVFRPARKFAFLEPSFRD